MAQVAQPPALTRAIRGTQRPELQDSVAPQGEGHGVTEAGGSVLAGSSGGAAAGPAEGAGPARPERSQPGPQPSSDRHA
ncbi:MAG: hypothetical protein NZ898_04415, partial [Myxococcota bacterium]|nr:hypothetical protein [Myxococcota bacterium]